MSSAADLKERIDWLERELPPNPPRFKIYDALPFAILRYDSEQEWQLRREARHLATRMENRGIHVETISLAEWIACTRSPTIRDCSKWTRSHTSATPSTSWLNGGWMRSPPGVRR